MMAIADYNDFRTQFGMAAQRGREHDAALAINITLDGGGQEARGLPNALGVAGFLDAPFHVIEEWLWERG